MPPKTRGNKSSKASKENISFSSKTKTKATSKVSKVTRKALADKTNSASDDNASFLQSKRSRIVGIENNLLTKQRPRREKRLPNRYIETQNLPNTNNVSENESESKQMPNKKTSKVFPPLKTPRQSLDSSLTANRPKRISRLPSKFNDHSISPSKYIPLQPAYASTPKVLGKSKETEKKSPTKKVKPKKALSSVKVVSTRARIKRTVNTKISNSSKTTSPNSSADTNNNAKSLLPHKTKTKQDKSTKVHNVKLIPPKQLVSKNNSIRILEDKRKSSKRDASNFDVYEFTYDPNEEPPPQKKKRKKPAKKREPKPKMMVFKDNYSKNMAKALKNLKTTISNKSVKPVAETDKVAKASTEKFLTHPASNIVLTTFSTQPTPSNTNPSNSEKRCTFKNYNSVRVEDIALDFEQNSFVDDVNYSPAHSVCQPTTPAHSLNANPERDIGNDLFTPAPQNNISELPKRASNKDPLNLREELSFFDDQPVASSSMNLSTRNPAASPWRVEFGNLPIKWQVNTYVKPNMTPAFDSSFMNFNDSKKKHVYTNIVTDTNEANDVPQLYEDYASKLKQTSILSFIKEVVESKAKKNKNKMTPLKANSLFDDINATSDNNAAITQKDHVTPEKNAKNVDSNDQNTPGIVNDVSNDYAFSDNSKDNDKENSKESTKSSSKKKRNKNVTYFGFDDTENVDQENVSPLKRIDKRKLRALKPRSRAVLQEINDQKGPTRAALPIAAKSKPTETVNDLFDQMKSATEPPVFLDKDPVQTTGTTVAESQNNADINDDQSVHLFEDLELVHYCKTHRKSYGKAKKAVTFRQNSVSDSDVADAAEKSGSSDEDDSLDLTFKVPEVQPKKTTRKKKPKKGKISKKEEQEVEAWAAGFNSMCEDIEEFDLVVE